jgi:hypothetical protein
MSSPTIATDYPQLSDDAYVIWSSNKPTWPDARRATSYLSATLKDPERGYALLTTLWIDALVLRTEEEAQLWLDETTKLRGHAYLNIKITTVAELKKLRFPVTA